MRRRSRLARGPITIGYPAAPVEPRLDTGDPYRPETIADGGSFGGLTVRAASVRGLVKRYAGGPRQDDLCLRVHNPTGTLIAAVADGVSGAPRSGLAAALAVRYASAAVARQLEDGAGPVDWSDVFEQAAWALIEEHRRDVGDPSAGVEDAARLLSSTLLVAAVSAPAAGPGNPVESGVPSPQPPPPPSAGGTGNPVQPGEPGAPPAVSVQVAAVGDSPALILTRDTFTTVLCDQPASDGLIGGAVQALPRGARTVSERTVELAPGSVLLLCTDGLALPLADGTGDVGRTFARELATPPDIIDFARLLDFSRETYDDDRTLVAIWLAR